jgi:hypothetical protein
MSHPMHTTASICSSPTTSNCDYRYTAVEDLKISICLNNCGIALLEQQLYHEAVVCFRTSVEGLKDICSYIAFNDKDKVTSSSSLQYHGNYDIRLMLDGALKLCCGSSGLSPTDLQSCTAMMPPSLSSDVRVHRINCVHSFDQTMIHIAPSDVVFPIWIDDFGFDDVFDDPWMAFAIVTYNFALAKRCQSLSHKGSKGYDIETESLESIEQEINFLTLSDTILMKRLFSSKGRKVTKMSLVCSSLSLVCSSAIILSTLLYTSYQRSLRYPTIDFDSSLNSRLTTLLAFIARYKQVCPFGNTCDIPAPAA